LDEGKVIRGKLVVARRDTTTLLDPVKDGQSGRRPNADCLKSERRGESHGFLDSECGRIGDRLSLRSAPTGYLAGKLLKGIDIREHGSKSIGATNVLRTLGKWPALVVLLVDVLKGAGAIVFARWFYPWFYTLPSVTPPTALDLQTWVPWAVGLAGLAVLLGHSRSIWLNFTGGKSAATGLGVLLALSWPVGLGAATVFGVALAIFRIVSVSSMLAALTAIALICGLEQPLPYRLLVIAGGLYVIVRHRANIQRLLAGTEPRLGQSSLEAKAASKTELQI
jgi:glycerol-3-phosphate acyltransferase PlsY